MLVLFSRTWVALATLWFILFAFGSAQQLKINYFNNNYCGNYAGELKYYWADTMAGNGNKCYNYNYGQSMLISDCYAGSWCVCLLYYNENCSGDYTTIQYSGHDKRSSGSGTVTSMLLQSTPFVAIPTSDAMDNFMPH
ncbi:hypothetical protein BR93DRAFT_963871 [Coniochaeta sp. PMI_546]|nr:hypothetical protein BR93DRAFT_963871 [Coniochaeta sp. PMI_546]